MQKAKSQGLITGFVALGLMLALCFFTPQSVLAQTAPQDGAAQAAAGAAQPQYPGWNGDCYYLAEGTPATGFQTIDGQLYLLDSAGRKQINVHSVFNGKLYYFGADGAAALFSGNYSGRLYKAGAAWTGISGSYFYKNGIRQTKFKKTVKKMDDGKNYYFLKDGKVHKGTGWKRIEDKRYYFKKGVAHTGWKYVGKYKYYFDGKGRLCQDLIAKFGNKWKKKELLIKVNRKRNCVTLYARDGKKGFIIPVKAMACSVGKAKTPTVKGSFYLRKARTYRWAKLGGPTMGGYCYGQYCSRITGSYLFHSVTYRTRNNKTLSTAAYNNLGVPASHGCIRLQTSNAKIIYDVARYQKTKVVIYDAKSAGPFDKPKVKKIKYGHKYDPTDPSIKKRK